MSTLLNFGWYSISAEQILSLLAHFCADRFKKKNWAQLGLLLKMNSRLNRITFCFPHHPRCPFSVRCPLSRSSISVWTASPRWKTSLTVPTWWSSTSVRIASGTCQRSGTWGIWGSSGCYGWPTTRVRPETTTDSPSWGCYQTYRNLTIVVSICFFYLNSLRLFGN